MLRLCNDGLSNNVITSMTIADRTKGNVMILSGLSELPKDSAGNRRTTATTRRLPALAAVVTLALVGAACGSDSESSSGSQGDTSTTVAGPTKLRISFVPATTVLPLHVAEEQGIFERNNLDVTLEQAANISDIPATLGRQSISLSVPRRT